MEYYSLEKKLSEKVVLLIATLFIVLSIIINIVLSTWLEHEYDEALEAKANVLVTLMKDTPEGLDFDFADEFMPEFEKVVEAEYFQIWLANGQTFERSHSLLDHDLPHSKSKSIGQKTNDLMLIDGRGGRMIEIIFFPQIPEDEDRTTEKLASQQLVTLVLARERSELDLLINIIRIVSIASTLIILFTIHFLIKHTVRKSLLPLHDLKSQIQSLDAENLKQRLMLSKTPIELSDVVDQLNDLLGRLEASFFREQRFSSDVAHELRTPISEIRSMSEIALKWPNDETLVKEFYSGVLESSIQMQTVVTNLMALARGEEGDITLGSKSSKLADLVNLCIESYVDIAKNKNINIINDIDVNLTITTSVFEFAQILHNLLSNAVSYCVNDSDVLLTATTNDNGVSLRISNITDQLNESDLEFLFDRFWRKSKARSSSSNSGIGLSLVKAYTRILKYEISTRLVRKEFSVSITNIKQ